jgi:hypothetical protein
MTGHQILIAYPDILTTHWMVLHLGPMHICRPVVWNHWSYWEEYGLQGEIAVWCVERPGAYLMETKQVQASVVLG